MIFTAVAEILDEGSKIYSDDCFRVNVDFSHRHISYFFSAALRSLISVDLDVSILNAGYKEA